MPLSFSKAQHHSQAPSRAVQPSCSLSLTEVRVLRARGLGTACSPPLCFLNLKSTLIKQ